ncbi:MAG TPA: class I SAM-dependent methyltransferase [Kineosporiaceae bacterium]|nr:class I SAM-dependent methyltransferase [Kineosporiaceae bacterium]
MDHDQHRRALWQDKATAYQDSFAGLCAYPMPFLLDQTGVGRGSRVLDVGCGTGSLSALALERGAIVSAVDAEPSMVAATRARVPAADARAGTLPTLPYPDGSFDVVLGNFVINHVGRPAVAVTELRRVTRPGGRIGISLWPRPAPPMQQLWDEVIQAAAVIAPAFPAVEENFPQTVAGAAELLTAAGLVDVRSGLLEWQHRVDPEQWWSGAVNGVAGIGFTVSQQDAPTVSRMKAEYDRIAGRDLDDEGRLNRPTAAIVATATRRT